MDILMHERTDGTTGWMTNERKLTFHTYLLAKWMHEWMNKLFGRMEARTKEGEPCGRVSISVLLPQGTLQSHAHRLGVHWCSWSLQRAQPQLGKHCGVEKCPAQSYTAALTHFLFHVSAR